MTCIAALSHDGRVYMGGESAGDYVGTVVHMAARKVFARGEYLMGYSGSGRVASLLRASFNPPKPVPDADLSTFMATKFCGHLYGLLEAAHALQEEGDTKCRSIGGALLVGLRGRIFLVDAALGCSEVSDTYFAIGSGGEVAMGVLYACTRAVRHWDIPGDEWSPEGVVEMAVEAAIHLVDSCGGRVDVLCVGPGRPDERADSSSQSS